MTKMRLLYVVNNPVFFLSHRLALAEAARDEGFDVHVATMGGATVAKMEQYGFTHHEIRLSRSGRNPLREMSSLISIWRLIRCLRPQLVHLVTIKPVLYGGIVARMAKVSGVISAISGLGFLFADRVGWRNTITQHLVLIMYKFALSHKNQKVIFQNETDKTTLSKAVGILTTKSVLIRGSGIDLNVYKASAELNGTPVIVMASRLIRDKGVLQFVEAARILKSRNLRLRMQLIGEPDPGNPESITNELLQNWKTEGIVECLGFRNDMSQLLSQAHIVVLPSYYGEGLPKILIEAAACGRAVVTTNMPGCYDAIIPDVSGLLIPPRDPIALANAIHRLVEDPELRFRMGKEGRKLAEREYSIDGVVKAHLDIYLTLSKPDL